MPIYSVQGPDGRIHDFEGPEGATEAQVLAAARQQFAPKTVKEEPKDEAQSGFFPSLRASTESLKGDIAALAGRTGLMDVEKAEKYRQEREEEAKKIFKPTEKGFLEAPVTKFKELLGGSLPYMAAPIAAGILAPEGLAGMAATGAASALQFTGSNLSRQLETGKKLSETNLGAAAAASIPQAALDVVSLKMIPGIKGIFGEVGEKLSNAEAKKIADQGLAKTLQDYAIQTGKTAGIEGTTEAAQQVLERLQAGLSLADPDARKEYLDNFLGGAVLGGALSVPGRAIERGQIKGQAARAQQEELKQQQIDALKAQGDEAAQKEAAAQQEELDKQKPEYLQDFMQNYEALQAQYKDLQSQTKKPDIKTALPADMEQYDQNVAQLKVLRKQLAEGSKEYLRVRPLYNQLQTQKETETKQQEEQTKQEAEKQRVAGMTPQEYMLEQMGEKIEPEISPEEHMIQQLQQAHAPTKAEPVDPVAAQASELVKRAQGFGQTNASDYAEYIMNVPGLAQKMVDGQTRVPGLSRSDNNALLSGLKLKLTQIEKNQQKAAAAELKRRNEELKQQTTTTEEDKLAGYKESEAQVEEQRETGEPNFDYLDPIFEKALAGKEPVVAVPEQLTPMQKGRAESLKNTVDSLLHQADQHNQEYWAAKRAGERNVAALALAKGRAVTAQIKALSGEGSPYTRELIATRMAQDEALRDLEDLAERMHREEVLGKEKQRTINPETGQPETTLAAYGTGMASTTMKGLNDKAEAARARYITASLQEAALHRKAFDKPALTTDEALKAASQMHDTLSEWIQRVQNAPKRDKVEQVMVRPAQMRAHKIIRPAEFEKQTQVDARPIRDYRFGAYDKAVQVIKEQLNEQHAELNKLPDNARRVEQLLKTQFATTEAKKTAEARGETATTTAGQLRRRTEFVRDKMAKMGGMRPAARDALNQAADLMDAGKASNPVLDAVENLVDRINSGRQVTQTDIRELNDVMAAGKPTAIEQKEAGQKSLFPETEKDIGYIRATPANFAKSPKLVQARKAVDDAKKLAIKLERIAENQKQARLKLVADLAKQVEHQRGDFEQAVARSRDIARAYIKQTVDQFLDPEIQRISDGLDKATVALDKEQIELDKINARLSGVLTQKEGANRTELATYQLFKYEEKNAIIADLQKEIADQTESLNGLLEAKHGEIDSAEIMVQAMMSEQVQTERKYLEMLEEQLADARGEPINARPTGQRRGVFGKHPYPFALRVLEKKIKNQETKVAKAEKDASDFKQEVKDTKKQLEELPGITRKEGRVEPIVTPEQKKIQKLHDDAVDAERHLIDLEQQKEIQRLKAESLNEEIDEAYVDFMERNGPVTAKDLKKLIDAEETSKRNRNYYQAKLNLLNRITSLEAQLATLGFKKSKRAQQPATVPSTSALSAAKGFRTSSEANINEAAQKRAEAKAKENTKLFDEIEAYEEGEIPPYDFGGSKEDPFFSRGAPKQGLTKKELEKELELAFGEKITSRGKEAQPARVLDVFDNVDEYIKTLPAATARKMESIVPKDAKGFVQDGKAILFANNIGKGHGLGVLLHEVGVHIGFRNFFNEGQYKALVNAVKSWAKRTDDSIEAKVGRAAMDRVKMANTPKSQIDDELLAYAVEEASQMGIEPTGVRGGKAVANWLRMIVDAFKKALVKFGLKPKDLTAGDMVNFAYGCANLELKGTWHGTAAKFDAFDHAYMGTGEGAQAYGWGTYRAQQSGIGATYVRTALRKHLREWENRPEIKQWEKESTTTYDGKTWEDIKEMGFTRPARKDGTPSPQKQMPTGAANILSSALRIDSNDRANNYSVFSPRQNIEEEVKDSLKIYEGRDKAETEKWFKENFDSTKIKGIHDKPLYQGYDKLDQFSNNKNKTNFASDVLTFLQKDVSDEPLDVKIKKSIEAAKKDLETTIELFADEPTESIYIDAKTALEEAKTFNPAEVTFKQNSAPPIPKPEGYLTRTIHTRPENEYLHWNEEKQSEYVNNRIEKLYNSLTKTQKEKFDSNLKPATHKRIRTSVPVPGTNKTKIVVEEKIIKPQGRDIYNAFSAAFNKNTGNKADKTVSEKLFSLGVPGLKFLDQPSRAKDKRGVSETYNYVDFSDKEEGAQIVAHNINPVGQAKGMLFSIKPKYNTAEFESIGKIGDKFIAKEKTFYDKVKANATGLAFETQVVDRFAGFERLGKMMESLVGTQMMYYLRMYDQRMNFVAQSVANGALQLTKKTRADGRVERLIESKPGPSLKTTVEILKDANQIVGNSEAVNRLFTLYLSSIRAKEKGFAALHFGDQISEAELNDAFKKIEANDDLKAIFTRARNEYNEYNRNQIKFVVESGALSQEVADRLLKENDYIPWYRERNGIAELIIGKENPIKIGSIAEQPYLHELVGGEAPILDFMTSSVQNTNILADMALRNIATKNAVFELANMDLAHIGKGKGSASPYTVRFKDNGVDKFAIIDTDKVGIPADVLVKGMEGIPTQMPFAFRMMGIPARLLRKAVTASPLYAAKQLFRDSLAAPILAGADFVPVLGSLKEIGGATKATLEQRGITGGQIFTGSNEDLTKILRDMASGKPGWLNAFAKFEALSMEADATTRRAQYNSYIQQGLSEMEATLMSLESMNFNKRGASPSVHILNSIIPFFNAQIQSLNVLYKAMTGKMPFNEKLKIQEKMLVRGAMIAAGSLAYAALMQDDDAYKNATPDQKYNNWFLRLPGVDEPIRLPIPFEVGYIFKALPEALYNTMVNKHGGEEAVQAFGGIIKNLIPGGTSYGIPQALKPAIEAGLGKSFYTGRDILSPAEQHLLPEDQFRANTTEAAKMVGKVAGVSPIVLEHLVSGYTGTLGLAFLQAVSFGVPKGATPEQAVGRLSEMPVVGGAFQPNDAGGIISSVYDQMTEYKKVKATFEERIKRGDRSGAMELLSEKGNEMAMSQMADHFTSTMKKMTSYENAIRASDLSPTEKRQRLDEIRKMKIEYANMVRDANDKTIRQ